MFHLLVSYRGWPDSAGTISTSRIYITDTNETGSLFLREGRLDISQISKVPALLTTEIGGAGPQYARVAHITSIYEGPRETKVQYTVDGSIHPISNATLEVLSPQLGIERHILNHTHWAVYQADLFKVLLIHQQRLKLSPKVFDIGSLERQEPDLVSVMMPFKAEYDGVYSTLQAAVTASGLRCIRADNFWEHQFIMQDVVDLIARARVVICDCSGKNPNVFYETGIAHAIGKEVILIAQSENDVPFDLRHIRYVRYLNNGEGMSKLGSAIQSRIRTLATQGP